MPKLSCDSTYFELQDWNDPALDKNGKEIIDPETDEPYNLKDWEAEHGRNFGICLSWPLTRFHAD